MGIESFRWLVGNGQSILFWEDAWCGDRPLRVEFPRLFRLALNKKGNVIDFSISKGFKEVNWTDLFSRPLLEREVQMVSSLKEAVSNKILFPEVEDKLLWKHDSK
ncbi:hypothetical protein ES332_A05G338300v1 [Gossypium tomentosum]|uniref:Reverse transcriptase zinc-binding domain-containing protein n=1 Tax=Gossypium tomentosum TaxID=34277 RepID=A0A5D2QNR4_GOSTO|nr:hypothetical protein ES332_A05G338300v1 [Gossypium tomentosum]